MNDKTISIEEYRKLKEGGRNHTSSEDEGDPSLQVDYELRDSSPTQSPQENNLNGVVLSEETTMRDSTSASSGDSNTIRSLENSKEEELHTCGSASKGIR